MARVKNHGIGRSAKTRDSQGSRKSVVISAAAQGYQDSLQQDQPQTDSAKPQPSPAPPAAMDAVFDTAMQDAPPVNTQSYSAAHSPALANHSAASTPAPARTATPTRTTNGVTEGGKAVSSDQEIKPIPTKAIPHGAPARKFLNEKVTGVILEGMKQLAKEQPKDPLRVLGEYLLQRSKELEV